MSCLRARVALVFYALVSIHLGIETRAHAQDRSAIDQVVRLNKLALRAHKARRHEAARDLLLEAEVLAETNGLMTSEVAARTYLNLGLVHLNGFQQKEKAVRYFAQAFQIRPKITLTLSQATRQVRLALREAQQRQKQLAASSTPPTASGDKDAGTGKDKEHALARAPSARPTPTPAEAKSDVALDCPVPGEAPAAQELKVHCRLRAGVPSERGYLFYRAAGQPEYAAVLMEREGDDAYAAAIPAVIVSGQALELYVEIEAAGGQVTATAGEEARPTVIALRQDDAPVNPVFPGRMTSEPRAGVERQTVADELQAAPEQRAEGGRAPGLRRAPGTFFLGLGVGTALGAHLTRPLEHHTNKRVGNGLSFGYVHLVPEVGFQYSERVAFSIQGRHQYIPATDGADTRALGKPPTTAHAVLARLFYEIWAAERLQLLATATVGGGSGFRLKIPAVQRSGLPSSDTIAGGPLVLGPGATVFLNFSDNLLLAAELRVLAGFNNVAAVAEGSVGLQYGF